MLRKILIIGCGSIGERYAAILRYSNIEYLVHDPRLGKNNIGSEFDGAIISSPTGTHVEYCKAISSMNKPFLVEKPLCKSEDQAKEIADTLRGYPGFLVCNYRYVTDIYKLKAPYRVFYDYYRTGQDGLNWDCCQLLYLDKEAKLETNSPRWNVTINGAWVKYRQLEESYIRMIKDFVTERWWNLWTMADAYEMVKVVVKRNELENTNRNTGQEWLETSTRKDLSAVIARQNGS